MADKIQVRRDTAANWTSENPTLSAGEWGFETDTGKLKIGDGSTAWTSLGYSGAKGVGTLYKYLLDNGTYVQGVILKSGSLSAGVANAIAFYCQNPLNIDGFVTKVIIDVTTAGGTAGAVLKVGLADDSSGTNIDTSFFTGLDLNAVAVNDSWDSTDTGTQTGVITWQDNGSGTDSYVVGKILTQNASSLVGKYYIIAIPKAS